VHSFIEFSNIEQELTCFVRSSSKDKATTKELKNRGIKVVVGDLNDPIKTLVTHLQHIDTVICSISPLALKDQIPLIEAAVKAGVKRFVPCDFGTPCARGVLDLRDVKESIHDLILRHHLGFTFIDVGFWYQASIPRVPSGRFDTAIFMAANEIYAGGSMPNMLIDVRDMGKVR
jgi:hypothetical protein